MRASSGKQSIQFESELQELLDEMDVWYTNLANLPLSKCNSHKSQIATMITTMKRLYPQRTHKIDVAVNTKLQDLFAKGDND